MSSPKALGGAPGRQKNVFPLIAVLFMAGCFLIPGQTDFMPKITLVLQCSSIPSDVSNPSCVSCLKEQCPIAEACLFEPCHSYGECLQGCYEETADECAERCGQLLPDEETIKEAKSAWSSYQTCCNESCGLGFCYFTPCNTAVTTAAEGCDQCISAKCCSELEECLYTENCIACLITPERPDCADNSQQPNVLKCLERDCQDECISSPLFRAKFKTNDESCDECVLAECAPQWSECVSDLVCSREVTGRAYRFIAPTSDVYLSFLACIKSNCLDTCPALTIPY